MKIKQVNIFGLVLFLTIINSILPVQATALKTKTLNKITNTLEYVPRQLLVLYKNGQSGSTLLSENRLMSMSSQSIGKSKQNEYFSVIKIKKDINLQSAMEKLKADPSVKAVSYNYVRQFHFSPNDPSYSGKVNEMWSLHDTAPDLTTFLGPVDPLNPVAPNSADKVIGNDIDAEKAWDIWNKVSSADKAKVIVAVIDTGVDYTHPDLIDAMWDGSKATINKVPSPTKYHGYDVADGDNDPYPISYSHGTHIAGTIAATTNNGLGIPGIASGVKIMAVKISSDLFVSAADGAIIAGINYAVENGADIINLSLGSKTPENKVYTEAVKNAVAQDVLLVISAGNSKNDNDVTETNAKGEKLNAWPAHYATLDSTKAGVISVAATDQADLLWEHSSFGATSVNIGAPGVNIKSTVTGIETKPENIASGSQIPYQADPAVPSPFTGDGNYPLCSVSPTTCFDNTFFSNISGSDCIGATCQWGWFRAKSDPGFLIAGDSQAVSATGYASSIDGTITSKVINVSSNKKSILTFIAQWDLECDSDYVDIEVFDGTNWVLLKGDNNEFNTNEAVSGPCLQNGTTTRSQHT
ncbi:MAG: S8 family serine peptidase, partial [Thiohalomonadales bacterium]